MTATNLDPAADGLSRTVTIDEALLPPSGGRVKVQFHWDRQGSKESDSSCWVRVATLWAGQGWGTIGIPRIARSSRSRSRGLPGEPIESVLHVELQIGDMTGSQTYPLRRFFGRSSCRGRADRPCRLKRLK